MVVTFIAEPGDDLGNGRWAASHPLNSVKRPCHRPRGRCQGAREDGSDHGKRRATRRATDRPRGLVYWPEIDGLRTVAVLSVFVFHFKRALLPGGFIGVDIFFVISGFLITAILLDDIAGRRFSIATFYQRRISRIFPALILVVCATLAAGAWLYSAQDLASLGINATAAAGSVINIKLMWQGSYFIISEDAQPLLHYWSLAVEEQFMSSSHHSSS